MLPRLGLAQSSPLEKLAAQYSHQIAKHRYPEIQRSEVEKISSSIEDPADRVVSVELTLICSDSERYNHAGFLLWHSRIDL